jgi:hypothetical protein
MTLKEFILDNYIDSIQYIDSIILNVVCNSTTFGLDVDTSNTIGGTLLETSSNFILTDESLIFGDIILNLENTNLL